MKGIAGRLRSATIVPLETISRISNKGKMMARNAVDASTPVTAKAAQLSAAGVTSIGRYYNYGAGPKVLTRQEASALIKEGISIWVVFQFRNNEAGYFSASVGRQDALRALECAHQIVGQPEGTAIYFGVDYDETGHAYGGSIAPYFKAVRDTFERQDGTMPYQIGVYGNGLVCRKLLEDGLVTKTWLSCSTGHSEHAAFHASNRWSISQTCGVPHIAGVDVDDDVLNPALQDCGQFSKLVSLMPAHTAAEAAVALPQFLAAANLLTETEVALTTDALDVSNLLEHIIAVAGAEWDFFGKQSYDGGGHLVHAGHTEGEEGFYERIGTYWLVGTGTHSVDGRNHDMPWSAAFISWVFRTAGAGTRFRYSTQHSVYISQGIRDFLNKRTDAGFWCMRLNERQPQPGDLVCWSRQQGIDYDHQNGGNYAGHTDIVTKVSDGQVFVIGGNVGDSVSRRILRTNSSGFLNPVAQGGETLFGLMANRLG